MTTTAKSTVRYATAVGLAMSVAMPCLPVHAQVPFVPKAKRPFSDIFTQDTALDARWTLSEPNPASSVAIGGKGLLLDASGQNGGADLWPSTNYKASLLLQPVSSTLDWTAMASIQFAAVNNYMGAGLVLTTQTTGFSASSVFHRFEYGHNPAQGLDSFTNGTPDPANVPFTADFVTLRVEKTGSTFVYSYLPRGGSWTVISTITDTNPYSYIGLISIRQPYDGLTNVDAKPEFKSFKISKVKKTTP